MDASKAYDSSKPGARPVSPLVAIENGGPDLADAKATVDRRRRELERERRARSQELPST